LFSIEPIFASYLVKYSITGTDPKNIVDWFNNAEPVTPTKNFGIKYEIRKEEPLFKNLIQEIEHALNIVHKGIGLNSNLRQQIYDIWGNRNTGEDFRTNAPHLHPGASMVGVYYAAADEGAGALVLKNPVEASNFVYPSSRDDDIVSDFGPYTSQRWWIKPEVGQLVIFPPWLLHWVLPNEQGAERISIALNSKIV
jgi:uncharacterized protein (TIGR02466 family)